MTTPTEADIRNAALEEAAQHLMDIGEINAPRNARAIRKLKTEDKKGEAITDQPELKPCPFCGDEEIALEGGYAGDTSYRSCGNCGATVEARWWNTRADLTPQPSQSYETTEAGE